MSTMINLEQLAAQADAVANFFYAESCYYTEPLTTLKALFGEENCLFAHEEYMHTLRLEPCGLSFSLLYKETLTEEERQKNLAQCALQALPPRRVAELVQKSLLQNDKSLAQNPLAVQFPLRCGAVPSRVCGKRQRYDLGTPGTHAAASESMIQRIAMLHKCPPAAVQIAFHKVDVNGATYIKCTIATPQKVIEPYVLCKTAATAEQHALLGAIVRASAERQ